HRAADVIEHRGRIRPIAADGAHRVFRCERAVAADKLIGRFADAFRAVADLALLLVDDGSLLDAAAARSQSRAARWNTDVDRCNLGGACRASEIRTDRR